MHRRSIAAVIAVGALFASMVFAQVAAAGGQPFVTALEGENEVPITGDLDGTGTAALTLNRGTGEVCWHIAVEDITLPALAAHIHEAPVGVPGDVVVTLGAPDASGVSTGCTAADRSLVKDIAKNPSEYYVNVHNADFPGGALRGQLS
jgi:CHRD domain